MNGEGHSKDPVVRCVFSHCEMFFVPYPGETPVCERCNKEVSPHDLVAIPKEAVRDLFSFVFHGMEHEPHLHHRLVCTDCWQALRTQIIKFQLLYR